ncbi:MAG: alpha/beta hydrolase, partial [Chloroflexota bacterium]|nr:alpha/beta hydrolase [Chloroflexota bacterium]
MTARAGLAEPTEVDVPIRSGRLHGQRFGSASAPLALCVPGLSANMKSFDFIGERLGGESLQVVALDLRGRGLSTAGSVGSYGWAAHARDVLDLASALGFEQFTLIGHSMGGAVGLQVAAIAAARLQRLVLIDVCGQPDPSTGPLIQSAVDRLGTVVPSLAAYIERVRRVGTVSPWSDYFERYFAYELETVEGGLRSRTSREAVLEDSGEFERNDVYALWRLLTMPVLLVRAARELLPGHGYIVTPADRDRFAREVPGARVVEVDANHYGIITAEATVQSIREFLGCVRPTRRARKARPQPT